MREELGFVAGLRLIECLRHVHESIIQKAVSGAAKKAGLDKRATCHTFRHSFLSHLIESGYDIRTVQELLGHNDVKTTMIYTHVLKRGDKGVKSPVDDLQRRLSGVLYGNHISPSVTTAGVLQRSNHRAYDEIKRGVLYRNLAAKSVIEKLYNHC